MEMSVRVTIRSGRRAAAGMMLFLAVVAVGAGVLTLGLEAGQAPVSRAAAPGSRTAPRDGEALIWYLGHCGFAVRTARHLLVFDYQERRDGPVPRKGPAEGGLEHGWIDPDEIRLERVRVFVTHSHEDHFDPAVLGKASAAADVRYFFGWQATAADATHHVLAGPRATFSQDGLQVATINSHHAGVPEVAFLVKVDGLVIYHNGDYRMDYQADFPYLQTLAPSIDIAFVPGVSREEFQYAAQTRDLLERFRPKAVFPMHAEAGAQMYREFADAFRQRVPGIPIAIPERLGQRFEYRGGRISAGVPRPDAAERLLTLLRQNAFRDAARLADEVLALPGTDRRTNDLAGLALVKAGRLDEAGRVLGPGDPEAFLAMGRLARARGNPAAAGYLRRAVDSADFYEEALRQLWRIAWEGGEPTEIAEVRQLAEHRFARGGKPLPPWLVNNLTQIEAVGGKRLFDRDGPGDTTRVPLLTNDNPQDRIRRIGFRLNGRAEYPFDIDSASADFMTLSPLLAEELGLPLTGSSEATGVGTGAAAVRFSVLDRVELRGITFRTVPVMVSDIHPFRGLKKGLIGTGFLKRFNVTLDVDAGVIDLSPLGRPDLLAARIDRTAVAADVPLYVFDQTMVEASVGGAPRALYILDSAAATHLVDRAIFEEHVKPAVDPARIVRSGIRGAQGPQYVNRVDGLAIALGGLVLREQTVHEFAMDALNRIGGRYAAGILGNPLLWPYRVHMDFGNGRLVLEGRGRSVDSR